MTLADARNRHGTRDTESAARDGAGRCGTGADVA